ncbi:unnamed protein product (macronuclear) [Paramecium tetraurelia]|uniref:Condensin complex subunit 1 C-terminal domain-containing protein n=1 Tax=Paramecium tetraurelia TaxID=5888 RepID=A0DGM3_PARTE|nr:uncharacterized protein GSPATT00002319001 [Paramecium tetraurelia]CAK82190.1 unnamed protein product [Paramecium tetraurelia]|eukprot:XP_001449587.1 hypothetical protein (macronuclear) [Paramecium tetraurelia strain d4-2]
MNELSEYPSIQFDITLYNSLKTKDSRLLLRQMKSAVEEFNHNKQFDSETFTILYYGVQQLQKDDILEFLEKEILKRLDVLEFEILQMKFLQATLDDQNKNRKDYLYQLQKEVLLTFGLYDKHGQMGIETILQFYKTKIKENDVKQYLQNQVKKIIRKENLHNYIKNRLIQIVFNSEDCDQQISDLLVTCENTAFVTQFITILAQNSLEILQNESNSLKQVSKVLERVSAQKPNLFNQNLPVFIQFYDSESYCLRNAINTIITNILTEHLNPSKVEQDVELKESQLNQRLFLIQKLTSRIIDKNAYARVHTLKMLRVVCSQNLIPPNVQLMMFPLVIARVQDVSSMVRKAALAFIKQITKFMKNLFVDGLQMQNFMKIADIKEQNEYLGNEIHKTLIAIDQILEDKANAQSEAEFKELEDEENLVVSNLREKKKLQSVFIQYQEFMELLQKLLPNIELLLNSKCITDIYKAISLISFLFKQKIENTDVGIMKMLIHSNNQQIVNKLAKKFFILFIENDNEQVPINNLIHLLKISSPKEQIYLEELIRYMIKQKMIPESTIEMIWTHFMRTYSTNQHDQLNQYSKLVRITFGQQSNLLTRMKLDQISKIIDGQKKEINWVTVIELAKLIYFLEDKIIVKKYFQQFSSILYFYFGTPNNLWFVACQEILNLVQFLPVPESIYDYIIKKFSFKTFAIGMTPYKNAQDFLEEESTLVFNNQCLQLSQLLFIVGQSALAIILHIDEIENQLTHLRNVEEAKENELDKIQGGCEEEYEYNCVYLQNLCKYNVIQKGFYQNYAPLVLDILAEIEEENVQLTILHKSAGLCLCKFMCLSEQFCEEHIEKVFRLIQNPNSDGVFKNNLIVAIGDLLHRWPNTVTSYCRQLFDGLSNQDFIVKQTSLNMLSHLILNDMIKIKREITDIAILLTDPDENIQQSAKRFFFQLQKKDSRRILNSLPDIIFSMSNQESHEKYKTFLINTLKYLDKQNEQLVEKLLRRLKENINDFEVYNIVFTLSKLQMKESLARKFYECYPYYQERLENPQIKEYFQVIIQKLMKCGLNQENKQILQEFEELLNRGETKRRVLGSKNKSQKSTRSHTNSQRSIGYSNILDQLYTQSTEF